LKFKKIQEILSNRDIQTITIKDLYTYMTNNIQEKASQRFSEWMKFVSESL